MQRCASQSGGHADVIALDTWMQKRTDCLMGGSVTLQQIGMQAFSNLYVRFADLLIYILLATTSSSIRKQVLGLFPEVASSDQNCTCRRLVTVMSRDKTAHLFLSG